MNFVILAVFLLHILGVSGLQCYHMNKFGASKLVTCRGYCVSVSARVASNSLVEVNYCVPERKCLADHDPSEIADLGLVICQGLMGSAEPGTITRCRSAVCQTDGCNNYNFRTDAALNDCQINQCRGAPCHDLGLPVTTEELLPTTGSAYAGTISRTTPFRTPGPEVTTRGSRHVTTRRPHVSSGKTSPTSVSERETTEGKIVVEEVTIITPTTTDNEIVTEGDHTETQTKKEDPVTLKFTTKGTRAMTTTAPPTDPKSQKPETPVPETTTRPQTTTPEIPEEITTLLTVKCIFTSEATPSERTETTPSERAVSDASEPEDVTLSPVVSEQDPEQEELKKPITDYPVVATEGGTQPVLVIEDAVLVTEEPVVATEAPVVGTDEPVVETEAPVKSEAIPTEEKVKKEDSTPTMNLFDVMEKLEKTTEKIVTVKETATTTPLSEGPISTEPFTRPATDHLSHLLQTKEEEVENRVTTSPDQIPEEETTSQSVGLNVTSSVVEEQETTEQSNMHDIMEEQDDGLYQFNSNTNEPEIQYERFISNNTLELSDNTESGSSPLFLSLPLLLLLLLPFLAL